MEIEVKYYYTMNNCYDDEITISVFYDNSVTIEYFNFNLNKIDYKEFENETSAYNWAYKRGYRE